MNAEAFYKQQTPQTRFCRVLFQGEILINSSGQKSYAKSGEGWPENVSRVS